MTACLLLASTEFAQAELVRAVPLLITVNCSHVQELHCKKRQNFHGNFPITLRAEFRNSKGRYIPSPYGIIPLLLQDQVNFFLNNATKVKIRKKYIVGLIFEIPLSKGKLPLT